MCKTLLRFQEYYESPKFRNKIFTLKEFKIWYKESKANKKFTYYDDWNGFNFPSYVLKPFYSGKFENLTASEKKILKTFSKQTGKFYVIATASRGDSNTILHEVAHALFYLDKQYQADAKSIVDNLKSEEYKSFTDNLKKIGYYKSVYKDETQAYLISSSAIQLALEGGKSLAAKKKDMQSIFTHKIKQLKINI